MPGILNPPMASRGPEGAVASRDGDSKKRTLDGKMVNGERGVSRMDSPAGAPRVNGAGSVTGVNGNSMAAPAAAMPIANQLAQLPPELEAVPFDNYHPLSKMLLRIGQECFNELTEVLQKMADLPSHRQANAGMTNGYSSANGGQESAELSKQKKLLLMQFAQLNRAKFIKLMVLTEWGKRSSADVIKCIDLFQWERQQASSIDSVDEAITELKLLSAHARQSNPDIRTALEILSKRKVDWIPDMGYIPPEKVSPEKALKLLRYMNTSLSIRLTVHETIPRHMQNWRIESGRVTFVVENEFEIDLMSFVEDTSEQWYFVDLRLLFSPAPSIDVGSQFYRRLQIQLDTLLQDKKDGLEKCYDSLHNFVLTHKINVLRSQASELGRANWTGALKVESVHRGLVVQYWTEKPGKKNWIEIDIVSNKPRSGKISWRGPPVPSLAVRWFRQGAEVKDAELQFDWATISMERIVKHVIARHVAHLLQSTQIPLGLVAKTTLSETEPSECVLELSMGATSSTKLLVEPVTGKFSLQPMTSLSSYAETTLNRPQEASNTGRIITQLLARTVVDRIQRVAQQIGWREIARQSLQLDVIRAAVKRDVLSFVLYWPRGWTSRWALAAIVDASGESWHIIELGANGRTVESTREINLTKRTGSAPPLNRGTLAAIERTAVHTLAYHATTRALAKEGKAFRLTDEFAQPRRRLSGHRIVRGWVLHLKTSDLLAPQPDEEPWIESGMRVICQGQRSDFREVWHIATGMMLPDAAADMRRLMAASPPKFFRLAEDGRFYILLHTRFGEEVVSELKLRLRDLNRLRSFAKILQERKMPLRSSSLQQVQFQYGEYLIATVKFAEGDDVKLHFGNNNPHKRIEHFLSNIVNDRLAPAEYEHVQGDSALERFCWTLLLTRPILTALDAIAKQQPGNYANPVIHSHSIVRYRMTYNNPLCSFDIRMRTKEDRSVWIIEDNTAKLAELRPRDERMQNFKRSDSLTAALQKLFSEKGVRWHGLRTNIIADIDGVPGALKRLHEAVLSCYDEKATKVEPPKGGGPTGAPPGESNNRERVGTGLKPGGAGLPNGKMQMQAGRANPAPRKPSSERHEIITID